MVDGPVVIGDIRDVDDEQLTPRQVAAELGVTVRTVQRWISDGRLPGTRVGGRIRVSRSSLWSVAGHDLGSAPATTGRRAIRSLLIANRGEIARRIAGSARRMGIRSVGIVTADDAPPDGVDELRGISSYLDAAAIVAVAREAAVDAIHPGYGFLSENPGFARAVESNGLVWIGPPPTAIAAMGDKAAARRRAAELGIPVVPGYDAADQQGPRLEAEARRIGLPILVKPAAGGGGKGMRVVRAADELPEALAGARREAERAFGDGQLILERYLQAPRHVEVQVLFDRYGHGVHLGERDCSTQRRHQKIIEESPGPSVSAELREALGAAALRLAASVGYVGAGTVEFLVDDDGSFFFLEMNTRLQVEHPVTEAVTGRDLVADQLRIAAGEPLGLSQAEVFISGHAIEARLYAEDAEAGFLPATGRIADLHWPSGVRVDAGIRPGQLVGDRYDPMLAKLIAVGRDRIAAIVRLRAALDETRVLGVRTNLRFLRWAVRQDWFTGGEVRTSTIADVEMAAPAVPDPAAWERAAELLAPPDETWGGGWRLNAPAAIRVQHGGEVHRVALDAAGPATSTAAVQDGSIVHVDVQGQSLEFRLAPAPTIEEAVRHAAVSQGSATLTAPMPGRVIAVRHHTGDAVRAGDPVVVIEAMKMEHAVVSPTDGTLSRIDVAVGDQVERGATLAEVRA
ncbi:MAG: ATP-grasp domain-containing protein [Chloroflexota bacterium]|nr:ATP-grasp domain-containing protein [Chloroflexota bacterium]